MIKLFGQINNPLRLKGYKYDIRRRGFIGGLLIELYVWRGFELHFQHFFFFEELKKVK
jgi:hypothetical protein